MPTEIRQIESKFFSELVNGSGFLIDNNNYATTLNGNVTHRMKAFFKIQIGTYLDLTRWQFLSVDGNYVIRRSGINFLEEGFNIGDTIALKDRTTGLYTVSTYTVLSSKNGELAISLLTGTPPSTNNASNDYHADVDVVDYINNITPITGLEYKYNLIENSAATDFISELTNSEQLIRVTGIPTTAGLGAVTGLATGTNKAAVMGDVTCKYNGTVEDIDVSAQGNTWSEFEITHEFVVPYYLDGEDDSLQFLAESPDNFNGTNSLKYVYEPTFFTDITNPESGRGQIFDTSKGSVGYFNENFNGFENPYTVTNVSYYDVTNSEDTDRIQIGNKTRVFFTIENSFSDFIGGQSAVVGHSAIIDSSKYSFSLNDFDDTWTFETLRGITLGTYNGQLITNYNLNYTSSSVISGQFDIEFSNIQASNLEENQNYILFLQVRNDSEDVNSSHPVSLIIDYNSYGKNADIEGLFDVTRFEQVPHPNDYISPTDTTGYTNGKFNVEEGVLSLVEFWLDVDQKALLEDLFFQIAVFNSESNYSSLRDIRIDLSDSVIVNDVQDLALDSTRGFKLKEGDQFNLLKLVTGEKIGNKQFYQLAIGYKIPWQSWLEFLNANPLFLDRTKPKNGLNQNTSNYSSQNNVNNFEVRFLVKAIVSQEGLSTTYLKSSENIQVYYYDIDDQGAPPTYTCSINTYNSNGVELANNIIENTKTEVRATFTPEVFPSFSENVDFTEAETTFLRFAHGELWTLSNNRLTAWTNGQASDTDYVTVFGGVTYTKNSSLLYTSTPSTILADQNLGAYYGLASDYELEFYNLTGEMYSTDTDNDVISYVIAFHVDEFGLEHTLSLVATTGGILIDNNPLYDGTDSAVGNVIGDSASASISLVYNFAQFAPNKVIVLERFDTSAPVAINWGDARVEDLFFDVSREGKDISASISWEIDSVTYAHTFIYDLNSNVETQKFLGAQSIGFAFYSQYLGGFKNVVLTRPSTEYYSILRIEPELSASDNSIHELSTEREAPSDNLLLQPSGTEIKASFSVTTDSFITIGMSNPDLFVEGQKYKLSSLIGLKNLGDLNLLSAYAWVDDSADDVLNVMFNLGVTISDITGLSLTGVSETISSILEVNNNFIRFQLSGSISNGDVFSFDYSGSNNIVSGSNPLSAGSINVKNDI